jgi:hypothetical protein
MLTFEPPIAALLDEARSFDREKRQPISFRRTKHALNTSRPVDWRKSYSHSRTPAGVEHTVVTDNEREFSRIRGLGIEIWLR